MTKLHEEIERCAKQHSEVARTYERSGNAVGAAELRRVENLLWNLAKGEAWTTVLPATETEPSHAFTGGGADGRNQDQCGLCGRARERCEGSKIMPVLPRPISKCGCELRDRLWNGYGRCLRCGCQYVDGRTHPPPYCTEPQACLEYEGCDCKSKGRA